MGGHGSQCLSALLNGSKLDKEEEKNHGAHLRFACLRGWISKDFDIETPLKI